MTVEQQHKEYVAADVDTVAGRTRCTADIELPGMLCGAVLRSPFAHARILRLDVSRALAMEGVHAVVTSVDLPDPATLQPVSDQQEACLRDLSTNLLAQTRALYEGHALAAVAAQDADTARRALAAIEVEFAVLPHVIDVRQAMEPEAPLLHDQPAPRGLAVTATTASNIASRHEHGQGDAEEGFLAAEVRVGEEFTTQPVHHGCLELPAALARWTSQGQVEVWSSAADRARLQTYCARLLALAPETITLQAGADGWVCDDTRPVGLEPLAILLARKAARPVKMLMTREEVFRAGAPVAGSYTSLRLGARKDGTLVAAQGILCYQAGAFAGSPVRAGCQSAFAAYHVPHVRVIGYDVVSNRAKSSGAWATGAAMAAFAVESLIDVLADKLEVDPLMLRSHNLAPAQQRLAALLSAASSHPHYRAPLAAGQGRGVAIAPALALDDAAQEPQGGAVHICDVEVDAETGRVTVLRYSAIHPFADAALALSTRVRMQGEIARGLGWALNEACLYDDEGRLLNPNFLDYRMPIASDLPRIDLFGADIMDAAVPMGSGDELTQLAVVPSLAAVANAVAQATGGRSFELPLTPPAVLRLIKIAARRRRR